MASSDPCLPMVARLDLRLISDRMSLLVVRLQEIEMLSSPC